MAGTITGGKSAAQINKAKHGEDFYKRIGAIGGKKGKTGGFAYAKAHYSEDDPRHPTNSGAKGGRISRRRKNNDSTNII